MKKTAFLCVIIAMIGLYGCHTGLHSGIEQYNPLLPNGKYICESGAEWLGKDGHL